MPFCEKEPCRYGINEPFVVGGFRYATDGKLAVRVPADGEPDADYKIKLPRKIGELFKPAAVEWLLWPAVEVCGNCNGSGVVLGDCDMCSGTGDHECSCGDKHECGYCEGDGKVDDLCDCRRAVGGSVKCGASEISMYYSRKISQLPRASYQPTATPATPVHFKFDGGEGVVMPFSEK